MTQKTKHLISILLAATLLFTCTIQVFASEDFNFSIGKLSENIKNCIVYDLTNDRILYSKNSDEKIAVASTTKLLTSLTALNYVTADEVFTAGSELSLVQPYSSLCLIQKGHKLKLETLIAGMLLPSGNDAAYTVAVNVARLHSKDNSLSDTQAVEYFCNLMNSYASSIGCNNSNFVNPEGWDDNNAYSTARDMLLITKKALENDVIKNTVSTHNKKYWFYSGENITWKNTNELLNPLGDYYYPYAGGLKTGTTSKAGKCLVSTATKLGRQIIILAYGCKDESDRFGCVKQMYETVFSAPVLGDVDLSGSITASDARLVLRASVKLEETTPLLLKRGDINKNSKLDSADARMILRASVKLENLE